MLETEFHTKAPRLLTKQKLHKEENNPTLYKITFKINS